MRRLWPQSLLARLSLVMVAGLLLTQVAVSALWTLQLRDKTQADVKSAAQYLGQGAASSIRFFRSLPPSYRSLLIQQFREMGGTRFYVALNRGEVEVQRIAPDELAQTALGAVEATLRKDLAGDMRLRLDFAWPDQLAVSPDGVRVGELPEAWVRHILLLKPDPAPILVIQTELEPGNWLYLATLMPNPYFLNSNDPLSPDKLVVQGVSLAVLLLLSFLVVRSITRPLAALSDAAEAFGNWQPCPTRRKLSARTNMRRPCRIPAAASSSTPRELLAPCANALPNTSRTASACSSPSRTTCVRRSRA
jgi:hypothetical protein